MIKALPQRIEAIRMRELSDPLEREEQTPEKKYSPGISQNGHIQALQSHKRITTFSGSSPSRGSAGECPCLSIPVRNFIDLFKGPTENLQGFLTVSGVIAADRLAGR